MSDLTGSLIVWLRTQLDSDVVVVGRVPRTYPDKLVVLRAAGGVHEWPVVDASIVEAEVWGVTETAAYGLAHEVRARIHGLRGSTVNSIPVYRVDDYSKAAWLPDPATDNPRFVLTLEVRHREELSVT